MADPFNDEIDADGALMRDKMAGLRCFSCDEPLHIKPNHGGPQYCASCTEDREMFSGHR